MRLNPSEQQRLEMLRRFPARYTERQCREFCSDDASGHTFSCQLSKGHGFPAHLALPAQPPKKTADG